MGYNSGLSGKRVKGFLFQRWVVNERLEFRRVVVCLFTNTVSVPVEPAQPGQRVGCHFF